VSCGCVDHPGKEVMNQTFNLSVERIHKLVFTDSELMRELFAYRKCENVKIMDWVNGRGHLEYVCNLGAFGKSNNFEDHVNFKNCYSKLSNYNKLYYKTNLHF
jgi:hypothetical protein